MMANQLLLLPCLLPAPSPRRITRTAAVDPFMTMVASNRNSYSRRGAHNLFINHDNYLRGGAFNRYTRVHGGKHDSYSLGGYDSYGGDKRDSYFSVDGNYNNYIDANYFNTANQDKLLENLDEITHELSKITGLDQQQYLDELRHKYSKVRELMDDYHHVNQKKPQKKLEKLDLELELSKIVGLEELKLQLRKWAKGMLMDDKRRAMGMELGPKKSPHMVFQGNPGTDKTMVARIVCKLLCSLGVISEDKLTEVQRSDLVGGYIGQTAIKTKHKIEEAMGGVLFVDEAYRLAVKDSSRDFGPEALEEIMSVMEDGNIVVIFAGYTEQMKSVFSTNDGFTRRITKFFQFDDLSCSNLAEMLVIKMKTQNEKSRLYGFKLHHSCTLEAVSALIEQNSSKNLRNKLNGGLVDHMLNSARENLDSRLDIDAEGDELVTITLEDLKAGVQGLSDRVEVDSAPYWTRLFESPPHLESENKT